MGPCSEIPLGTGPTFAPDLLPGVTRVGVFRNHPFLERLTRAELETTKDGAAGDGMRGVGVNWAVAHTFRPHQQ